MRKPGSRRRAGRKSNHARCPHRCGHVHGAGIGPKKHLRVANFCGLRNKIWMELHYCIFGVSAAWRQRQPGVAAVARARREWETARDFLEIRSSTPSSPQWL
jgi:hypothetical protein